MATSEPFKPLDGGCPCRNIRYRLTKHPLFIHCCHCTWCQRETGSAFGLNAIIESKFVELTASEKPIDNDAPTPSGQVQRMWRCSSCKFVVWSNYGGSDQYMRFIRVGTLDEPGRCPPSIQIYTSTKLPWVILDDSVPIMDEYYEQAKYWPKESLERAREHKESFQLAAKSNETESVG